MCINDWFYTIFVAMRQINQWIFFNFNIRASHYILKILISNSFFQNNKKEVTLICKKYKLYNRFEFRNQKKNSDSDILKFEFKNWKLYL